MRDWTEIETMYITGNMSQKELAESLQISYSTLSKVATENKWSDKRKKFRKKTANKGLERASARISRKLAKLAEGTELLIDAALKALGDEKQFYRYIVSDGVGEGCSVTKEQIFDKLDAKALKDVTSALRDLTAMRRDLFGLPTQGPRRRLLPSIPAPDQARQQRHRWRLQRRPLLAHLRYGGLHQGDGRLLDSR